MKFKDLFDVWAPHYDVTVSDRESQYHEVFYKYEEILNSISSNFKIGE